jgi:hypothetical protein
MLVAQEPKIGLSDLTVKQALEADSSSDYFFGLFNGASEHSTSKYLAISASLGIAVAAVIYLLKQK